MDNYQAILVDRPDEYPRVAIITLNRPEALNALNRQIMIEVIDAATKMDADSEVGCIIITGAGRSFAAGADIKEMQPRTYPDTYVDDLLGRWDRLAEIRAPIIAAVAGHALGAGCELAMMCDMLIAADNAKFGQPEIRLASFPEWVAAKPRDMDMCLTGRTMRPTRPRAPGWFHGSCPSPTS
jgi:enoyl-CoA hydratase